MSNKSLSRRAFLSHASKAALAYAFSPTFSSCIAYAQAQPTRMHKNIIRIFLSGGTDSLALFPYIEGPLAKQLALYRPNTTLADPLSYTSMQQLSSQNPIGFHPEWRSLLTALTATQCPCAVVDGYGVTEQRSYSHEIAKQHFNLGVPDIGSNLHQGWIGRLIDAAKMEAFSVWGIGAEADRRMFEATTSRPIVLSSLSTFRYANRTGKNVLCTGIPDCPQNTRGFLPINDSIYGRTISERLRALQIRSLSEKDLTSDLHETLSNTLQELPNNVAFVEQGIVKSASFTNPFGASSFDLSLYDILRTLHYTNSAAAPVSLQQSTKIFCTSLLGWDTHIRQGNALLSLTRRLSSALATLVTQLQKLNLLSSTVIILESEFGRTTRENGSLGTDHGGASKALILGGSLKNGLRVIGAEATLLEITQRNFITPQISFTAVWREILHTAGFTPKQINAAFPHSYAQESPLGLV